MDLTLLPEPTTCSCFECGVAVYRSQLCRMIDVSLVTISATDDVSQREQIIATLVNSVQSDAWTFCLFVNSLGVELRRRKLLHKVPETLPTAAGEYDEKEERSVQFLASEYIRALMDSSLFVQQTVFLGSTRGVAGKREIEFKLPGELKFVDQWDASEPNTFAANNPAFVTELDAYVAVNSESIIRDAVIDFYFTHLDIHAEDKAQSLASLNLLALDMTRLLPAKRSFIAVMSAFHVLMSSVIVSLVSSPEAAQVNPPQSYLQDLEEFEKRMAVNAIELFVATRVVKGPSMRIASAFIQAIARQVARQYNEIAEVNRAEFQEIWGMVKSQWVQQCLATTREKLQEASCLSELEKFEIEPYIRERLREQVAQFVITLIDNLFKEIVDIDKDSRAREKLLSRDKLRSVINLEVRLLWDQLHVGPGFYDQLLGMIMLPLAAIFRLFDANKPFDVSIDNTPLLKNMEVHRIDALAFVDATRFLGQFSTAMFSALSGVGRTKHTRQSVIDFVHGDRNAIASRGDLLQMMQAFFDIGPEFIGKSIASRLIENMPDAFAREFIGTGQTFSSRQERLARVLSLMMYRSLNRESLSERNDDVDWVSNVQAMTTDKLREFVVAFFTDFLPTQMHRCFSPTYAQPDYPNVSILFTAIAISNASQTLAANRSFVTSVAACSKVRLTDEILAQLTDNIQPSRLVDTLTAYIHQDVVQLTSPQAYVVSQGIIKACIIRMISGTDLAMPAGKMDMPTTPLTKAQAEGVCRISLNVILLQPLLIWDAAFTQPLDIAFPVFDDPLLKPDTTSEISTIVELKLDGISSDTLDYVMPVANHLAKVTGARFPREIAAGFQLDLDQNSDWPPALAGFKSRAVGWVISDDAIDQRIVRGFLTWIRNNLFLIPDGECVVLKDPRLQKFESKKLCDIWHGSVSGLYPMQPVNLPHVKTQFITEYSMQASMPPVSIDSGSGEVFARIASLVYFGDGSTVSWRDSVRANLTNTKISLVSYMPEFREAAYVTSKLSGLRSYVPPPPRKERATRMKVTKADIKRKQRLRALHRQQLIASSPKKTSTRQPKAPRSSELELLGPVKYKQRGYLLGEGPKSSMSESGELSDKMSAVRITADVVPVTLTTTGPKPAFAAEQKKQRRESQTERKQWTKEEKRKAVETHLAILNNIQQKEESKLEVEERRQREFRRQLRTERRERKQMRRQQKESKQQSTESEKMVEMSIEPEVVEMPTEPEGDKPWGIEMTPLQILCIKYLIANIKKDNSETDERLLDSLTKKVMTKPVNVNDASDGKPHPHLFDASTALDMKRSNTLAPCPVCAEQLDFSTPTVNLSIRKLLADAAKKSQPVRNKNAIQLCQDVQNLLGVNPLSHVMKIVQSGDNHDRVHLIVFATTALVFSEVYRAKTKVDDFIIRSLMSRPNEVEKLAANTETAKLASKFALFEMCQKTASNVPILTVQKANIGRIVDKVYDRLLQGKTANMELFEYAHLICERWPHRMSVFHIDDRYVRLPLERLSVVDQCAACSASTVLNDWMGGIAEECLHKSSIYYQYADSDPFPVSNYIDGDAATEVSAGDIRNASVSAVDAGSPGMNADMDIIRYLRNQIQSMRTTFDEFIRWLAGTITDSEISTKMEPVFAYLEDQGVIHTVASRSKRNQLFSFCNRYSSYFQSSSRSENQVNMSSNLANVDTDSLLKIFMVADPRISEHLSKHFEKGIFMNQQQRDFVADTKPFVMHDPTFPQIFSQFVRQTRELTFEPVMQKVANVHGIVQMENPTKAAINSYLRWLQISSSMSDDDLQNCLWMWMMCWRLSALNTYLSDVKPGTVVFTSDGPNSVSLPSIGDDMMFDFSEDLIPNSDVVFYPPTDRPIRDDPIPLLCDYLFEIAPEFTPGTSERLVMQMHDGMPRFFYRPHRSGNYLSGVKDPPVGMITEPGWEPTSNNLYRPNRFSRFRSVLTQHASSEKWDNLFRVIDGMSATHTISDRVNLLKMFDATVPAHVNLSTSELSRALIPAYLPLMAGSNMKILDLSNCETIKDDSFITIRQMQMLEILDVRDCKHVTFSSGLSRITDMPFLTVLCIDGIQTRSVVRRVYRDWEGNAGFRHANYSIDHLPLFRLTQSDKIRPSLPLANCPRLKRVFARRIALTNEVVFSLCQLSVEELDLSHSTGLGLNLPNLVVMTIAQAVDMGQLKKRQLMFGSQTIQATLESKNIRPEDKRLVEQELTETTENDIFDIEDTYRFATKGAQENEDAGPAIDVRLIKRNVQQQKEALTRAMTENVTGKKRRAPRKIYNAGLSEKRQKTETPKERRARRAEQRSAETETDRQMSIRMKRRPTIEAELLPNRKLEGIERDRYYRSHYEIFGLPENRDLLKKLPLTQKRFDLLITYGNFRHTMRKLTINGTDVTSTSVVTKLTALDEFYSQNCYQITDTSSTNLPLTLPLTRFSASGSTMRFYEGSLIETPPVMTMLEEEEVKGEVNKPKRKKEKRSIQMDVMVDFDLSDCIVATLDPFRGSLRRTRVLNLSGCNLPRGSGPEGKNLLADLLDVQVHLFTGVGSPPWVMDSLPTLEMINERKEWGVPWTDPGKEVISEIIQEQTHCFGLQEVEILKLNNNPGMTGAELLPIWRYWRDRFSNQGRQPDPRVAAMFARMTEKHVLSYTSKTKISYTMTYTPERAMLLGLTCPRIRILDLNGCDSIDLDVLAEALYDIPGIEEIHLSVNPDRWIKVPPLHQACAILETHDRLASGIQIVYPNGRRSLRHNPVADPIPVTDQLVRRIVSLYQRMPSLRENHLQKCGNEAYAYLSRASVAQREQVRALCTALLTNISWPTNLYGLRRVVENFAQEDLVIVTEMPNSISSMEHIDMDKQLMRVRFLDDIDLKTVFVHDCWRYIQMRVEVGDRRHASWANVLLSAVAVGGTMTYTMGDGSTSTRAPTMSVYDELYVMAPIVSDMVISMSKQIGDVQVTTKTLQTAVLSEADARLVSSHAFQVFIIEPTMQVTSISSISPLVFQVFNTVSGSSFEANYAEHINLHSKFNGYMRDFVTIHVGFVMDVNSGKRFDFTPEPNHPIVIYAKRVF